jgi:hypothetical protein
MEDEEGKDITKTHNEKIAVNIIGTNKTKTVNLDQNKNVSTGKMEINNNTVYINGNIVDSYADIIFVDSENGSDGGLGTFNDPYKTLGYAINQANNNNAIKMKDGTYYLTPDSSYFLIDKEIDIFGNKTDTIIDGSNVSGYSWLVIYDDVGFYNLKIKATVFLNVSVSLWDASYSDPTSDYIVSFTNCVIEDPISAQYSYFVTNDGGGSTNHHATIKVENSVINNYHRYLYGNGTIYYNNSVINITPDQNGNTYISNATITNSIEDVELNSDYSVSSSGWKDAGSGNDLDGSPADLGVYGGPYSW